MNTIIIYSSKYGSTADCAKYLKSGLSGSVSLVDIDKLDPQTIDLEAFDTILIGSSVYIGAVSKKIRAFCNKYARPLSEKRVGIFLCCASTEQLDEYLTKNFSTELLQHALLAETFGGEARFDRMKFVDKLVMKAAMKGRQNSLKLLNMQMDAFLLSFNMEH